MRGIPYREAVGALMWVANMTRPDLVFTAHTLAKFGDNPGPEHWKAVMKALQYLKRTASLGLVSRAQRITATATSESEYVALAEVVNELRFLRQVKA
ncbi:unnamed protein product, partial [Ascophyllum nodosum]